MLDPVSLRYSSRVKFGVRKYTCFKNYEIDTCMCIYV